MIERLRKGNAGRFFVLFSCLTIALVLTSGLQAQELRGKVTGTVSDASGAVIPGAAVTLTNDDTTVSATTSTNEVGSYLFDFVLPGTYTVTWHLRGKEE